jgi:hypothetical protein
MNVNKLRRNMRAGGWARHAANLPGLLLEHGVPYQRTRGGRTVRVSYDTDGGLEAHVKHGEDWMLIADSEVCHLPIDSVPQSQANPMAVVTIRMPADQLTALDAMCARLRVERSAALRRAVSNYLEALA